MAACRRCFNHGERWEEKRGFRRWCFNHGGERFSSPLFLAASQHQQSSPCLTEREREGADFFIIITCGGGAGGRSLECLLNWPCFVTVECSSSSREQKKLITRVWRSKYVHITDWGMLLFTPNLNMASKQSTLQYRRSPLYYKFIHTMYIVTYCISEFYCNKGDVENWAAAISKKKSRGNWKWEGGTEKFSSNYFFCPSQLKNPRKEDEEEDGVVCRPFWKPPLSRLQIRHGT